MASRSYFSIAVAFVIALCVLASHAAASPAPTDKFHEQLLVHPLPSQLTMTHFQFSIDWTRSPGIETKHFNLFPKAIGKLIDEFGVEEMRLSFTRGRWEYTKWGQPPLSAPQGAELWAFFQPSSKRDVDQTWKEFTHALSGLFCASLTYMHSPFQGNLNATKPIVSFRPQSHTHYSARAFPPTFASMTSMPMRHGILQGESICTENLTPWSKLLPCRVQAGLGKLLNRAPPLLDVHYSSVAIHFRPVVPGTLYQLVATLTLVAPADPVQGPISDSTVRKFSLNRIFSSPNGVYACPAASTSQVFVLENPQSHTVEANLNSLPLPGQALRRFDLQIPSKTSTALNLVVKFSKSSASERLRRVQWLDIQRWTSGWGLQRGQLAILITNKLNTTVDATLHQVVPWLMRLYFHTIRFTQDAQQLSQREVDEIAQLSVLPSLDRVRPSVLEIDLKLAPRSQLLITIEYDNNFLHWTEHPPDAHRGFDISAATLTVRLTQAQRNELSQLAFADGIVMCLDELDWSNETSSQLALSKKHSNPIRLYTDGLLLMLPTPDFSMPYNVITLTSTIWALFFGSVLNMMLRRYKDVYAGGNEFRDDRPIVKIARKVMALFQKKKQE